MKRTLNLMLAIFFITSIFLSGCKSSPEKKDDANQKLKEAEKNLNQAQEEYLLEIENYRKETSNKISENDKAIESFKQKIANEKSDVKESYEKKIDELEKRNKDLKAKLDQYKADGKENWEKFKSEFNRDMDELGKAFKDLTVNNVK